MLYYILYFIFSDVILKEFEKEFNNYLKLNLILYIILKKKFNIVFNYNIEKNKEIN